MRSGGRSALFVHYCLLTDAMMIAVPKGTLLNPIPEVAAALVCQVVNTDSTTGSKPLANVFSNMSTQIPRHSGPLPD
jgi:hypothetical protein